MTIKSDFLIVGQGLASSILAWRLIQRGARVCVIDDNFKTSSSIVAAGLINPLAGRRLHLPHNINQLLSSASNLYNELAQQADHPFFHSMPMLRLVKDQEQLDFYDNRASDPEYAIYLGERFPASDISAIHAPNGGFIQHQTGYLDTSALLNWISSWLLNQSALQHAEINYDDILIRDHSVKWKHIEARRIIFCEGYRAQTNPWFSWLPFQLAKGEILQIAPFIGTEPEGHIINSGKWLVPANNGVWRFGATNEWSFNDPCPTDSGTEKLAGAFRQLFPGHSPQILHRTAGVRPATRDREPFIGHHPELGPLSIFNGFGAKGSLLIPWHADRFADNLISGEPLPFKANITRYAP